MSESETESNEREFPKYLNDFVKVFFTEQMNWCSIAFNTSIIETTVNSSKRLNSFFDETLNICKKYNQQIQYAEDKHLFFEKRYLLPHSRLHE